MFSAHVPYDDFEGRLQSIIRAIHARGFEEEALLLIDQLRKLPGILGLLAELRGH
jgi:hypothetical protein